MPQRFDLLIAIVVMLSLIAYLLPWVVNPAAGLTLGGYDLAEWLNLHPETHPERLPGLLLRGHLVVFTWIVAFSTVDSPLTHRWWLRVVAVLLLVILQLPPPDFVYMLTDPNQRQQAILAVISLLGAVGGLSGVFAQYHIPALIALAGLGFLSAAINIRQAPGLMETYGLSPQLGLGGIALMGLYGICAVSLLRWICQKANRVAR